jgi:hypothetical protein
MSFTRAPQPTTRNSEFPFSESDFGAVLSISVDETLCILNLTDPTTQSDWLSCEGSVHSATDVTPTTETANHTASLATYNIPRHTKHIPPVPMLEGREEEDPTTYLHARAPHSPSRLKRCTKISSPDTSSCATNAAMAIMASRPLFSSLLCMSLRSCGSVGSSPSGSNPRLPGS